MLKERLKKIKNKLLTEKKEAFLVIQKENQRYLSGFTGSNALLLITQDENFIITDFRYWEQAQKEAFLFKLIQSEEKDLFLKLKTLKAKYSLKHLVFEGDYLTFSQYRKLKDILGKIKLYPSSDWIEEFRKIKDEEETKRIRIAAQITDQALTLVLKNLKAGITEKEIAQELEYQIKKRGGDKIAFDIIVASGKNASLPHAKTTERKITESELIVIDLGTNFQGYNSDLTRTIFLGEIKGKLKKIYRIVWQAQKEALESVKPEEKALKIDQIARNYIEKSGFGDFFGHALGHGVGLAVHEGPVLSKLSKDILKEGMIFTVEPGIYLPEIGGVRIEDLVLVTKGGYEILTKFPK